MRLERPGRFEAATGGTESCHRAVNTPGCSDEIQDLPRRIFQSVVCGAKAEILDSKEALLEI